MSAEANLAGLYPPKGQQVFNPNITWQPIPVHTVPDHMEKVSHFNTLNVGRLGPSLLKYLPSVLFFSTTLSSTIPLFYFNSQLL